jgi:chlorite dismutase
MITMTAGSTPCASRGRMGHKHMTDANPRRAFATLNAKVRYTMWSVFRADPGKLGSERGSAAREATAYIEGLKSAGVVVRGIYDLAGLRADADYMIWWHAAEVEALQGAYASLRRETALGRASKSVWSQVALHRPAVQQEPHPSVRRRRRPEEVCVRLPIRPLL